MTVDDGEQYTVPSLAALEHNLEAAMHKVRSEKDRKIGGEMSYLENMVSVYCTPLRSTRFAYFLLSGDSMFCFVLHADQGKTSGALRPV